MLFSTIEAGTEIQTQPTESGGGGGGGNIRLEMRGVKEKKKTSPPPIFLLPSLREGTRDILLADHAMWSVCGVTEKKKLKIL